MANPVEMTVNAAYAELQNVYNAAKVEDAALNAQKLRLQNAYSTARANSDTALMKSLDPLIHVNSTLRVNFRDMVAKYNSIVNGISSLLKKVGLNPPALSGVGVLPTIVIPIIWVVAILAVWDSIRRLTNLRSINDSNISTLLAIASDPSQSAANRQKALDAANKRLGKPPGGPFDLGDLVPLAAIVLLIVVGPQLLRTFGGRRARMSA